MKHCIDQYFSHALILSLALATMGCGKDENRASGIQTAQTSSGSFSESTGTGGNPVLPGGSNPGALAPLTCDGSQVEILLRHGKRLGLWHGSNTEQPEVSATAFAHEEGLYEFYTAPWGLDNPASDETLNESFYTRIFNAVNTSGAPVPNASKNSPNCLDQHVVVDNDNQGNPEPLTYMGTFYLVKGDQNTLTLNHFCHFMFETNRANCTELEFEPNGPSGCLVCAGNNLEVLPQGICVRKLTVSSI